MARSVPWRRVCPDDVSWRQDQAENTTIFILRQTGPTGFLVKEEGENKNFKVYLGDPNTCTCSVFKKEHDLCKHICWLLLKKFRVSRQNAASWQKGLVEREINEIIHGVMAKDQRATVNARRLAAKAGQLAGDADEETPGDDSKAHKQKEITEDDVCPICQEELLAKHWPVTYCKFGCGNNVHIKCMKVWAEHQKSQGKKSIECPFCREDFGPFSLLQQEFRNTTGKDQRSERLNEHHGAVCRRCNVTPIVGKCYKCISCVEYNLCQQCFNTATHTEHSFQFRQKPNQRWRPAQRGIGAALPEAVMQNLQQRDISDQDYDLLLQLDRQAAVPGSDLTEETVNSFPMERVRQNSVLLAPGQQCRICLRPYQAGQLLRRLPCRHKYHKDCIDQWLLHQNPTCPSDGTMFTNESVKQIREAELAAQRQKKAELNGRLHGSAPNNVVRGSSNSLNDLSIPGIGIARMTEMRANDLDARSRAQPTQGQLSRGHLQGTSVLSPHLSHSSQESLMVLPSGNNTNSVRRNSADTDLSVRHTNRSANRQNISANRPNGNRRFQRGRNISSLAAEAAERRLSQQVQDIQIIETPEVNGLNIGRLTEGVESVLENGRARSGGSLNSGGRSRNRAGLQSNQLGPTIQDRHASGPSDLDVNGTQYGSIDDAVARLRQIHSEEVQMIHPTELAQTDYIQSDPVETSSSEPQSQIVIESQPPSIPTSHQNIDLSLNVGRAMAPRSAEGVSNSLPTQENSNKPPTGATGTGQRKGRLRSKPLYRDAGQPRSASRERPLSGRSAGVVTPSQGMGGLYIGHNPNSVPGFTSNFFTNIVQQEAPRGKNKTKTKKKSSNSEHRWGSSSNLQGDDFQVSGNSVN